jgi:hypothetical protein
MKAHFNVMPEEWQAFLQRLRDDGWELIKVDKGSSGHEETYNFRRLKKNE